MYENAEMLIVKGTQAARKDGMLYGKAKTQNHITQGQIHTTTEFIGQVLM